MHWEVKECGVDLSPATLRESVRLIMMKNKIIIMIEKKKKKNVSGSSDTGDMAQQSTHLQPYNRSLC